SHGQSTPEKQAAQQTGTPATSDTVASTTSIPVQTADKQDKQTAAHALPIEEDSNVLFSRNIADGIQDFITSVSNDFLKAVASIRSMIEGEDTTAASSANTGHAWRAVLPDLLLVMVVTIVAFVLCRMVAKRIYVRSNHWINAIPRTTDNVPLRGFASTWFYRKSVAIVFALLIDAAVILLAGAVGYA